MVSSVSHTSKEPRQSGRGSLLAVSRELGEPPYLQCTSVDGGCWNVVQHATSELIDSDTDTDTGTLCAGYETVTLTVDSHGEDTTRTNLYVWALSD